MRFGYFTFPVPKEACSQRSAQHPNYMLVKLNKHKVVDIKLNVHITPCTKRSALQHYRLLKAFILKCFVSFVVNSKMGCDIKI